MCVYIYIYHVQRCCGERNDMRNAYAPVIEIRCLNPTMVLGGGRIQHCIFVMYSFTYYHSD